jgi:outer membrane immunogenic protein
MGWQSEVGNRKGDTAMKKLLLTSVALAAWIAAGPAGAADVAARPVYKAAPPVAAAAFNWSRCYVGVHGGYGWGRNTNDFGTAIASGPTEAFEPLSSEFGPFHHNTQGWLFGGQAGCNWQFTPHWVIGVEGELKWSGIKGSFTALEDNFPFGDPGQFSRFQSRNLWDGDLALRLGWVSPIGTLFYAKAGVAFGRFDYTETHDDFPTTHGCPGVAFVNGAFINGQCSVTVSRTNVGWLVGVGFETPFTILCSSCTFKGEWDFIDYGTHTIPYPSAGAAIQNFAVHDIKHIFKIGLNFYFP